MTPAPLQLGQAPSELALNSAGFTPLAFANALRIGSSSPVYVQRNVCHRDTRLAHAAASVGRHAADVGGRSRHDSRCNQGGRRGYSSDGRATTTMKKATTTMKTRVSGFSGVERVGVMDGGGAWGEAV